MEGAEGAEPLAPPSEAADGESPAETLEELDERLRRTRETHADAAEIVYGGIRASACESSGELAENGHGRFSLEPPTLESTATETGHVPADCPRTQAELNADKLSTLLFGTCLLAGYGAAKVEAWWSNRRGGGTG